MAEWINCSERMPELVEIDPGFWESAFVFVYLRDDYYGSHFDVMYWRGEADGLTWQDGNDIYYSRDQVTHWMPLPLAPERG